MLNEDNLILVESDGVKGKYLCSETNEIIEAIGTVAVPRDDRVIKYKAIVIWSKDKSITKQALAMKKICEEYKPILNDEILKIARNTEKWEFGTFLVVDASKIIELSKNYNIDIEMIDTENGSKLVI